MTALLLALLGLLPPGPAAAPDTGAFHLVQDGVVIATERFRRTEDSLWMELTLHEQGRVVTRAVLAPDATIRRVEVRTYPLFGADDDPIQTSAAEFRDGVILLEDPIGSPIGPDDLAVPPGTLPYIEPSPSLLEQILLRARVLGGAEVEVPLWVPGRTGATHSSARVVFRSDAVTVELGGVHVLADTDADGRLLSASIPRQDLSIWRTGPGGPGG